MKIKVLIVDDEQDFSETLAERLRMRNIDCDFVTSGVKALTRIKQDRFDVVLLDVLMPSMNGIETYREIRKLNNELQVVMLTGHAKIETAIDGMKDGVYDYLLKPVIFEDLVKKIEMAYQRKRFFLQRLEQNKSSSKSG